ncbi:MAG: hypothetical protein LAT55_07640, partial [Opitutales bacterium]|nr:hypothetical protein [Opitutales bacterium]
MSTNGASCQSPGQSPGERGCRPVESPDRAAWWSSIFEEHRTDCRVGQYAALSGLGNFLSILTPVRCPGLCSAAPSGRVLG